MSPYISSLPWISHSMVHPTMTLLKHTTVLWVVVIRCLMVFLFLRERAVCQESERCMRSQAVRDPTQQYKITRGTKNGTVQQTAPQWNETTSLHNLPDSSMNCECCRNEKQSGEQWRRVGATTMVLLRLVWNLCVFLCEGHTKRSHILQFEHHVFKKNWNQDSYALSTSILMWFSR